MAKASKVKKSEGKSKTQTSSSSTSSKEHKDTTTDTASSSKKKKAEKKGKKTEKKPEKPAFWWQSADSASVLREMAEKKKEKQALKEKYKLEWKIQNGEVVTAGDRGEKDEFEVEMYEKRQRNRALTRKGDRGVGGHRLV
jgi:hypothetical protein